MHGWMNVWVDGRVNALVDWVMDGCRGHDDGNDHRYDEDVDAFILPNQHFNLLLVMALYATMSQSVSFQREGGKERYRETLLCIDRRTQLGRDRSARVLQGVSAYRQV